MPDTLDWTLDQFEKGNLPSMLERSGYPGIAAEMDNDLIRKTVPGRDTSHGHGNQGGQRKVAPGVHIVEDDQAKGGCHALVLLLGRRTCRPAPYLSGGNG